MQTERVLFRSLKVPMLFVGWAVVVIIICQGCAQNGKAIVDLRNKLRFGDDVTFLEKGFAAYDSGKYPEATEIFEELYDNSGSLMIRRQALYGLAICGFLKADTPDEFHKARLLWQEWRELRIADPECEDPVYLEPFLNCKFPDQSAGFIRRSSGGTNSDDLSDFQYDTLRKRNAELEAKIKSLEKQYSELQKEKDSLNRIKNDKDATIQVLKEKIKALEDIDQKIQEKKNKTEISSPE